MLKFFLVCEELCILTGATHRALLETPLALSFFKELKTKYVYRAKDILQLHNYKGFTILNTSPLCS
ncbi:hypothetical protein [Chlamydia pneumoniae J138]|nr:hypothetical protein [Chlamydia pneumoniae J138]